MNEKRCPICKKVVRSSANEKHFCALCGMGIPKKAKEGEIKIQTQKSILYFCCNRCAEIYKNELISM
ncbi:MAG: hypothetical protein P8Y70_21250 [Candidatus Lokiarchaeota archaeon]